MSAEARARGHKAALNNPRVSDEAKEHSRQELEQLEQRAGPGGRTTRKHEKNEGNVIGGFKATLKNPNVSEEAKEHAAEQLEERGVDVEEY